MLIMTWMTVQSSWISLPPGLICFMKQKSKNDIKMFQFQLIHVPIYGCPSFLMLNGLEVCGSHTVRRMVIENLE